MSGFTIRTAFEEDLNLYPDFFALAPLFNTMNLPAQPIEGDESLLARVRNRTVDKLVLFSDKPVFFISFRKAHFTNTIDTMIFNDAVPLDREELYELIRKDILDKGMFLPNSVRFEYPTTDQPLNHEVLQGLGFSLAKNHRIMNILLGHTETKVLPLLDDIEIREVQDKADVRDRVRVQNDVFENRNRIPLTVLDVEKEMRNMSYLPELSLLLKLEGLSCAYGQIINNPSGYYLVNFGVIPEFQGRGLSHYLLADLLKRAKEQKIEHILLEVYESNIRAVRLYEQHGFRRFYNKCLWVYQKDSPSLKEPQRI